MDRDGVSQFEFVEFAILVDDLPLAETHDELLLLPVHGADAPDVPVEDLLVVVVRGLDHLVAGAEEVPVGLIFVPVLASWIERRLQAQIQLLDAEASPVHGAEDLDPVDRVDPEMLRQAVAHH